MQSGYIEKMRFAVRTGLSDDKKVLYWVLLCGCLGLFTRPSGMAARNLSLFQLFQLVSAQSGGLSTPPESFNRI